MDEVVADIFVSWRCFPFFFFVVAVDSDGSVLAGAENAGLFRITADGRSSEPWPMLAGQSVSSLLLRDNGELWVGTFGDGQGASGALQAVLALATQE